MEDCKKKYKEALERARIWKEKSGMPVNKQSILDNIFPELKESEDERIRKELISFFTERAKYTEDSTFRGLSSKEIITWLEKRVEQKSVSNALKEAFDKSRKDYSLEEKKEASDYSESIIPTSIAYGESEEEYMLHKIIEAAFIAGQNTKQKPAWSEEDEEMLNDIIQGLTATEHLIFKHDAQGKTQIQGRIEWLKSIKERVQSQNK